MQCPNCSFEIRGNPRLCPNCSDTLPQPEPWEGKGGRLVDYSTHYWILLGNLGTIVLGGVVFARQMFGVFALPLAIALLFFATLSLILSRAGKAWDDEPLWKRALIWIGPWISIGSLLTLIAYLFFQDDRTAFHYRPSRSSGVSREKKHGQEQQESR